ncbi:MAG: S8/S53 family peptidase, partial [Bryobacterales bacterium]|nr:S8/S53 family peptidase [Bryobacterales bacterium]
MANAQLIEPLASSVHPKARREYDAGRVPPDLSILRMRLVLRRSPGQQAALDLLAAAQQDPQSPAYHQWLSPEDFGSHFGLSQNDLNTLIAWLQQSGFTIDEIPRGRWTIIFHGTAGQVETAFHTEVHFYDVKRTRHYANSTPLQIPKALAPLVEGVLGVHDFRPLPLVRWDSAPELGSGASHYLVPTDYATIYDINPLYSSGTEGFGQTIAIVGRCNIETSIVQTFRALTGLPSNTTSIVIDGPAPSPCTGSELVEPYLDVEWSGAVAKNANITLVVATDITDAASYIVDNNLAPVMSTSFGECEADLGVENQWWSNLWEQASSQGITSIVSSGDSGAAGCDDPNSVQVAVDGLGVNGLCSTPYDICVGGTEFNDFSNPAQYWSTQGNALGYIPEEAWNESGPDGALGGIWATGGGYSTLYPKNDTPWQTGNTSPWRGVPDVSLSAASHDGYFICKAAGCNLSSFTYAAGTSAASPCFAALMALVVQNTGTRQGVATSLLYSLASRTGVFHDVVLGNNTVPGQTGYLAAIGWDPVTGLGSVDANSMVTYWGSPAVTTGTATSVTSNSATLNGTVNPNGSDANYMFLYGTNSSFMPASQVGPVDIGAGTNPLAVSANISDLSANTTYYFELLATNAAGTTSGLIGTFKTSQALESVTTPSIPSGPASGIPGASYSYSTGGASDSLGNPVEYLFNWGDGTNSGWLSAGTASASHSWPVGSYFVTASARSVTNTSVISSQSAALGVAITSTGGELFVPMTPCRLVDTRVSNGAFGSPSLVAGSIRDFVIPDGSCGIPSSAAAYSVNVTVVPWGTLDYLTVWPTAQAQPLVSTLNSLDARVKANAAIIPAGAGGAVSAYSTNATDLILDIDGYFVPETGAGALAFYPLTPCRLADTRSNSYGTLGWPSLSAGQTRTFDVLSSACNIPASAQAYSLNFTAIPAGPLPYITAYPAGQTQPLASTLNALTGAITANAAIVPAGTNGALNVFTYSATDLVIDINGYFAPAGTGGLSLYNLTPCRVLDTRQPPGTVPFSGEKDVEVLASSCTMPA